MKISDTISRLMIPPLLCLGSHLAYAQHNVQLAKDKYHNNKVFEDEFGYVQAIKVDGIIYISGIAAKGTMEEAIVKVYDRLEKILAHYHLTTGNVVRETIYTTKLDELIKAKDIRKKYYGGDYPASTWLQVARFYSPEAVIEVEFTVVAGEK
jgi:2-iminobutanoate/2-iminopropanoate deaminase